MHIHILGICGTFMGGLALIARELGYSVSGCDAGIYPPMSDQLRQSGIQLVEGYEADQLDQLQPDLVVVGNAMRRGIPVVEYLLNKKIPYTSGPQFLCEHVLQNKWVMAVSGTHGKTTTTSMLTWILEYAGMKPGFLVGGIPANFGISARLGDSDFFVIEADEYDTAFFDKRSKFVHYRPNSLIINNLEFDHADIFADLAAIQKQFHHLIRTVPSTGLIVYPAHVQAVDEVLEMGCWSSRIDFGAQNCHWRYEAVNADYSEFNVFEDRRFIAKVSWEVFGAHNASNALAAIAAAKHAGIDPQHAADALGSYKNTKRRLETRGNVNGVTVYDDFAHHPTAIRLTMEAMRARINDGEKLIAILEPRSNTMRMGIHKQELIDSLQQADEVFMLQPADLKWQLQDLTFDPQKFHVFNTVQDIIDALLPRVPQNSHCVIMSNGGFDNIHNRLLEALQSQCPSNV